MVKWLNCFLSALCVPALLLCSDALCRTESCGRISRTAFKILQSQYHRNHQSAGGKIHAKTFTFSMHGYLCMLVLSALKECLTGCGSVCVCLNQVMQSHGVRNLVFSSSATVYGDPQKLPIDEQHPVGGCTNPYGKTKYFIEEMIRDQCTAEKVDERSLMTLLCLCAAGV